MSSQITLKIPHDEFVNVAKMSVTRSLTLDRETEAFLDELVGEKRDNFGLIVGQLSSEGDFAVFLAPTLPPQENKVNVEEDGGDGIDDAEVNTPTPPNPAPGIVLKDLTKEWVIHHSHQLSRLLTGGLEIIGFFVVCDPDIFLESTPKLKTFFTVLEKQRKKRFVNGFVDDFRSHRDEGYLIHGCSRTGKISCKSISLDSTAPLKAIDLKFQNFLHSWSRIDSSFGVDCVIDIPADKLSKLSLIWQIQHGLTPMLKELWLSKILLTPATSSSSAAVIVPPQRSPLNREAAQEPKTTKVGRKGGRKGQGDAPSEAVSGRLYSAHVFKRTLDNEKDDKVFRSDCATQMIVGGTVCARAHMHAKASVEDSINALKKDMLNSVLTRCELLCDDMLTEEDQETRPSGAVIYELPLRIYAPVKDGLTIADFMFRDETKLDAVERIKEVTGHEILEEALETAVESFVSRDISPASSIESLSSQISSDGLQSVDNSAGFLQTSSQALKRHYVSVLCAGGALAALFTAYLQIEHVL